MEHDNLELVQGAYGAFGRGDLDALLGSFDDDAQWHSRYPGGVPLRGVWTGHEGIRRLVEVIGTHVEVEAFEPVRFLVADDAVVVLGRETAKVRGTGRRYDNEWVHVWLVRDGRVHRLETYNDTASVLAAFEGRGAERRG